MATFVYALHWLFLISALSFSWRRSRSILHPHFMFTVMICVQLVDFLVRGYDDQNLILVPEEKIYEFQLIILMILGTTIVLAAFISSTHLEAWSRNAGRHLHIGRRARGFILLLVLFIVLADTYKRFSTVDWSVTEVIRQSLMPRGQRDWDQLQYSGNFLFAITTILLPLGGIAAGFLTSIGHIMLRFIAFCALMVILLILVTNGSRTPVVIVLATAGLFWYMRQRTTVMRWAVMATAAAAIMVSTSVMILFRAYGFVSDRVQASQDFELTYHMDDSYYRAIFAYDHANKGVEYWDAYTFFSTIAANPIPRAFWPGKPLFTPDFYGGYKLDYVTNLYLGEVVAITGVYWTIVISPLVGLLLYLILFRTQKLIRMPMGLAAYLLFALYVYMCIRSLPNLTHFLYLPAFAAIVVMILNRGRRQAPRYGMPRPAGRR